MKRLLLTGLIIVCNILLTNGQNYFNTDSLYQLISKSNDDYKKSSWYGNIASSIVRQNPDSALKVALTGKKLAIKSKNDDAIALNYQMIGNSFLYKGEFNKAFPYYDSSLVYYRKIKKMSGVANVYLSRGIAFDYTTKFDSSLNCYTKVQNIADSIKDINLMASSTNNIGLIYAYKGKFKESLPYLYKSLKNHKLAGKKYGMANNYTNIGKCHTQLQDYEKARAYMDSALVLWQSQKDMAGQAMTLNAIAEIYVYQEKYSDAIEFARRSLEVSETMGDNFGMAENSKMMGRCYYKIGEYEKAIRWLEKAEKYTVLTHSLTSLTSIQELLYKSYLETQDYKKAFEIFFQYKQNEDSIQKRLNNDNLVEIQEKYESKRKEEEIQQFQKEKLISNLEIQKKQNQIIWFIVVLVLMVVLLGFAYYNYKNKHKANLLLNKKNEEIASKNHEIMQSITYAKRLQQSILPPPRLVKEYMKDSFVLYMPKDIVAGDFYWIESHKNKIYFAAADCTGHGVPGAMVSMVCHNALNRALLEFNLLSPSLILDKASELVDETFSKSEDNVQDGMDVSLYCLDTTTLQLEWAGANNPLWMIQNGEFKEIKADKQPVGRYENRKPFTNHVLQLNEGDSLFSITDGYPDQFGGEQGKKYTYKKLREFLIKINDKPMALQKDELIAEFDKWKAGQDQVDDVCIIGVKI